LISNALKYRSDRLPRIEVSAKDQGDSWLFSVRDNDQATDTAKDLAHKAGKKLEEGANRLKNA
jgi:light-regulated signal transduction histidine kinase (bacteriophytochrome)